MKKYDFIIAGGGMSGLSLAYYLVQSSLRDRTILLIDRERKERNDRTWCFWERDPQANKEANPLPFDSILFRTWKTVSFHGTTFSGPLAMGVYRYSMLRGIDFYAFVAAELAKWPNVERQQATIRQVEDTSQGGKVVTDGGTYFADYVFDSTFALTLNQPGTHNLRQHFKGWIIRTATPCFDPSQPEIMDFRIPQQGDCRFLYVLPFDDKTALVEYTLFNATLLEDKEYDEVLHQYIRQFVTTASYQIQETEFGIIPMSDEPTEETPSEHIIRIGTSGGFTKASTGYTFYRTQRYLQALVKNLAATGKPIRKTTGFSQRFKLYDSIFLNVLEKHRHPADDIFTKIYTRNNQRVFTFLDEDTSLLDEIQLFASMPFWPFLTAFFDVLRRKISR